MYFIMSGKSIDSSKILNEIRTLALMPQGQVCKHFVMLNLLNMLEVNGCTLDANVVKAVSDADDTQILSCLNNPQT